MSERIQPVRVVDETQVVIDMKTRGPWGFRDFRPQEIRNNAEQIARLIASVVNEYDGFPAQVREVARKVCPECGLDWEIDPKDGLPSCCDAAQKSWREAGSDAD